MMTKSTLLTLSEVLPKAVKYSGPYTTMLEETNDLANLLFQRLEISSGSADISGWFPMAKTFEESDFESIFFEGELHPTIDGYWWYRAYWIEFILGQGLILTVPWIHPQDSRPNLVLIVGNPPGTWVVDVINAYLKNFNAWLDGKLWLANLSMVLHRM